MDLVEVAPMANPPVCRIMDYGKFKFDEAQRAKESRRKTVHVGLKEMKYRPKIGPGDFDTKTRQVGKFLEDGHKVKITIMFRGREVFHPELGKRILDRICEQMDGTAKVEAEARLDGRNMVMVLAPDKRAKQSAAARQKNENHDVEGTLAEVSEDTVSEGTAPGATEDTATEGTATGTSEDTAPGATEDTAPGATEDTAPGTREGTATGTTEDEAPEQE
jgi:translation initiation factor IF-3